MKKMIKFRGKRNDDNKWVYGIPILLQPCNNLVMIQELEHIDSYEYRAIEHTIVSETIGQFTGFYDKNDQEIYDEDIIKTDWNTVYIVRDFRLYSADGKGNVFCIHDFPYFNESIKIGNIHDNPELIK